MNPSEPVITTGARLASPLHGMPCRHGTRQRARRRAAELAAPAAARRGAAPSIKGYRQPESTSAATRGDLAEGPRRILSGELRGAARAPHDGVRAERRSLRELAVDVYLTFDLSKHEQKSSSSRR